MSVYVDDVFIPFGRMRMCHMIADTEQELHAMAVLLGLRSEWFQDKKYPHYDISKAKRAEAIRHGVIEVSVKELIALAKGQERDQEKKSTHFADG